jgi:L-threonylcarbamoyladenylate synthase
MLPERIALSSLLAYKDSSSRLLEVAARIADGAVFVYPTDTIYGIGGRYDRDDVYKRIISVKERAPDQPMILLGSDLSCFAPLGLSFSPAARQCAASFWPGLLTMVLPAPFKPEGIAIRVSDHPFIIALSTLISVPLFSTSANISGQPYQSDPDVIFNIFGSYIDFMIDAGILPVSLPSTVIKFTKDNKCVVVREGCISAHEIHAIIGSASS